MLSSPTLMLAKAAATHHTLYCPTWVNQLRAFIYMIFEYPQNSKTGKVVMSLLLLAILTSVVGFILESDPDLIEYTDFWAWFDGFFSILFTVEYVSRIWVCTIGGESRWTFIIEFMNVCDLLAILPFYIELLVNAVSGEEGDIGVLRVLRVVRLTRVFRLFKLGRYSSGLNIMAATMRNSQAALVILLFFLFLAIVLFSSLIYFVESASCPFFGPESKTEFLAYSQACHKDIWDLGDSFMGWVQYPVGVEGETPVMRDAFCCGYWCQEAPDAKMCAYNVEDGQWISYMLQKPPPGESEESCF